MDIYFGLTLQHLKTIVMIIHRETYRSV